MARSRHDDDSDPRNPFDRRGVLKDGRSFRVSATMRDSADRLTDVQRAVLATAAVLDGRTMIDGSLHKPGHRFASADGGVRVTVSDTRKAAYDSYEQHMSGAWRTADTEIGRPGDVCTVRNDAFPRDFGSAGHYDEDGICTPDRLLGGDTDETDETDETDDSKQTMDEVYAQHDAEQAAAWRTRT
jgi:hypothetical protein